MRKKHDDSSTSSPGHTEKSIKHTMTRLEELADTISHYFNDDEFEILAVDELESLPSEDPINDSFVAEDKPDNIIPFPPKK